MLKAQKKKQQTPKNKPKATVQQTIKEVAVDKIIAVTKNQTQTQILKALNLGIKDLKKKYSIKDMVKNDVIFLATGVTDGEIVSGIKTKDDYFISHTLVLHKSSRTNKILKNKIKK